MAMLVTESGHFTPYNPAIMNSTGVNPSSLIHTLQPATVESFWSDTSAQTPAGNNGNTGAFYMPGLQASNATMMPPGFPYNVMFSAPQPVTAGTFADMYSSGLPLQSIPQYSRSISNPSSAGILSSDGASADGKTSPFQTVNRLALDSAAAMEVGTPGRSKSGNKSKSARTPGKPAAVTTDTNSNVMKPPKRPLTSYMRFSKAVWQQVKQENSDMNVCEIGVIIGKLWRQLSDDERKRYFDEFTRGKAEYDDELKTYMDTNGLKLSDLPKPKIRNKKSDTPKKPRTNASAASDSAELKAGSPLPNVVPVATWPGNENNGVANWSTMDGYISSLQQQPSSFAGNKPQTASQTTAMQQPSDGMVVLHLRKDGTPECYIQRDHVADSGHSAAVASYVNEERGRLLALLNDRLNAVRELKSQLRAAQAKITELEQQNDLLRQLRDAHVPVR